jgi:hypothetical protein
MKRTLRKELYRPRSRRINTNAELRKTTLLRNNLSRTFNRKLITTFNSFAREETDALDNSQSFVIEKAQRNLNNKITPLFESEYRKVFAIVYRNNEKKYKRDKKQDGTVFGRNVYLDPVIKKFLENRSRIFSGITIQMSRRLRDIIAQEFESGQTLPQITSAIRKEFGFFSRRRANLIARTETHTALGFANHDYHKNFQADTGITMLKRWRATNDARTRSFHSEANGQTVPMDEKFTVGGAEMDYVGDPAGGAKNVINCRCVVIYVDEQDVVDGVPAFESPTGTNSANKPYGLTEAEELTFHQKADWELGEAPVLRTVKNASPVKVNKGAGSFYYDPINKTINMKSDVSDLRTKVLWRHEYGHALDVDKKFKDAIVEKFNLNEIEEFRVRILGGGVSSIANKQIIRDRRKLMKKNNEAFDEYRLNTKDGLEFKKSYAERFGFKNLNVEDGVYDSINIKDTIKAIRDYLKDTDGFLNTEFLDTLFGTQDWVEQFININLKRSFRKNGIVKKLNVDDLLNSLGQIKYNVGGLNYLDDLYRIGRKIDGVAELHEELLMFSDFVGSVSNNNFFRGHPTEYYKQFLGMDGGVTMGHAAEAFANYTALMGSKNARLWREILEQYVPDTLSRFDELFDVLETLV